MIARLAFLFLSVSVATPVFSDTFSPQRLREIDLTIERAVTEQRIVGGLFWLERHGEIYRKTYGQRAIVPRDEAMTLDTIFDVASLTKVVATTPAIMILVERGKVDLAAPVSRYISEFSGGGREVVTVRQLMTHTSGLRPGLIATDWAGYDTGIRLTVAEKPLHPPGSTFIYSDLNFILLGEIVRRVSATPLQDFVQKQIFRPLGMNETGFLPARRRRGRIAPTEETDDAGLLRGRVHDPTARRMGGIAGHAGLFTTAHDLARYARMIQAGGTLEGVRVLAPESVRLMTSLQTGPNLPMRRGLGWDIDSTYSRPRGNTFPLGSFGHTGWTGTFLWIDPFSQTFYVFLSNRVHPDGQGSVLELQRTLGTLAAEATGVDFASLRGTVNPRARYETLNGIDVVAAENFAPIHGLRIGLITNQSGRDRAGRSTIDLLHSASTVKLRALFSPEHGIRGDRDELIADDRDTKTGLPIYSLYGKSKRPSAEQLEGLDALVFDVQDIGARFYTYVSTMGHAMEAAAEAGLRFFVLDRINPITGQFVEGPVRDGDAAFTAWHPIVVRHGMTVGELALMFKEERGLKLDLTVVRLRNWQRWLWQDQTWIPWVNPSPNMRSLTAATLYPGVCLLEATEVSVGRGTATPFEIVGAPYIDEEAFAAALEKAVLPGARFEPVRFTPDDSVFKGQLCKGVRMRITNRDALASVDIGIVMAQLLHQMYPRNFTLSKVNNLLRHPATIDAIRRGENLSAIKKLWNAELADFRKRREKYLLYE